MYPSIGGVSTYFLSWGVGFLLSVSVAIFVIPKERFARARSLVALVLLGLTVLTGAKLWYFIEAAWFPDADYVPQALRGVGHGFRIPGGIVLLAVVGPFLIHMSGLAWKEWGDKAIIAMPLLLVSIRIGCFLNGCCFGRVADTAWAVRFPEGSWAYWYHRTSGLVGPNTTMSLPVHPLQIYFALAALAIFVVVRYVHADSWPYGRQLVFYALFFSSTAMLEPFRANYLALNSKVTPILAASSICALWICYTRRLRACTPGDG